MVSFLRTNDIECSGLPEGLVFSEAVKLILEYFDRESDHRVAAVQACPGRVARVTFVENGEVAKAFFEELGVVMLGEVECRVVKPPPPPPQLTLVVVSCFPFEGSNEAVSAALSGYGTVRSVRNQVWPGRPSVSTGSRIVQMVVEKEIPHFISVHGVRCRAWYRGQPLRCDSCRKIGHRSAVCPFKGKCFKCQKEGHWARNCKAAAGAPAEVVDVPAVADKGEDDAMEVSAKAELSANDSSVAATEESVNEEVEDECLGSGAEDNSVVEEVVEEGFASAPPSVVPTKPAVESASFRKRRIPTATGGGITKKAQHTLPRGAVVAAKQMVSRPSKLMSAAVKGQKPNVDSSIFKKDPGLSFVSEAQATFLWEIVMECQQPPSTRRRYGYWRSDNRYRTENSA